MPLRHALERLACIPGSFLHALTVVGHIQRLVLELSSFSTYTETVRPRFYDPNYTARESLNIRGAFTNNVQVAQEFYRVGFCLWLLQEYTPHIAIQRLVQHPRLISTSLSLVVAFPAMGKDMYDPQGTWKDPSKWPHAGLFHIARFFASGNLPLLDSPNAPGSRPRPLQQAADGRSDTHRVRIAEKGSSWDQGA